MPSITFTITDAAQAQRLFDGLSNAFGYSGFDPQGNAETKANFVKRVTVQMWKDAVARAEHAADSAARGQTTQQDVNSNIVVS